MLTEDHADNYSHTCFDRTENPPLVSAIITTHNRKRLLEKAVQSVFNQTYPTIECIIVDDASDDGTVDYAKTLGNRVKYIRVPVSESRGANFARNLGLCYSRGEYVAFLDDDDEWLPDKINLQVKAALENPSVGFVYCGRIDERDGAYLKRKPQRVEDRKYKSGDLSTEVLVHVIATTSTIFVKRDLIVRVGGFDEGFKAWQEYDLCVRLLQETDAYLVRENLVIYRIISSDTNRNSNQVSKWESSVKLFEEKYQDDIAQLSAIDKIRRKYYVAMDGLTRSRMAHDKSKMVKYAAGVFFNPGVVSMAIGKLAVKGFTTIAGVVGPKDRSHLHQCRR